MANPAAPLDARSASTKALDTLLLFAEHDFECDWFRYDSEGFHRSCSCGRDDAVEGVRACLAETAPAPSPNPDAGHVVAMLTGLPVELNSLLPEGSIFMHPRTFHGLPPEHPSWLDRMMADAKKVTSALDGDGRDGFNGSGPFEG